MSKTTHIKLPYSTQFDCQRKITQLYAFEGNTCSGDWAETINPESGELEIAYVVYSYNLIIAKVFKREDRELGRVVYVVWRDTKKRRGRVSTPRHQQWCLKIASRTPLGTIVEGGEL